MGIQYITDNTACNYDSSVKKIKSTNHNQTSSCFTVYRSPDSFSMTLEFFRSRLRNPNHKRAPTQIKAKCAEGGFGEVMSHTHPSAGLHYAQRQSFQCRQYRAAPGHPCIRCSLWLLPLSSQLCCWQWKIICVQLCLNVPRVRTSSLTPSMHKRHMDDTLPSAFPTYNLTGLANSVSWKRHMTQTDRQTFDTRAKERVFSTYAYF